MTGQAPSVRAQLLAVCAAAGHVRLHVSEWVPPGALHVYDEEALKSSLSQAGLRADNLLEREQAPDRVVVVVHPDTEAAGVQFMQDLVLTKRRAQLGVRH